MKYLKNLNFEDQTSRWSLASYKDLTIHYTDSVCV